MLLKSIPDGDITTVVRQEKAIDIVNYITVEIWLLGHGMLCTNNYLRREK